MRRFGGTVVLLVVSTLGAAPGPVWSAAQRGDAPIDGSARDGGSAPESQPGVPGEVAGAVPSPWLGVRDVRVEPAGDGRRLVIAFTRAPEGVHDFALKDPPRLVFDVRGPQSPKANALTRFPVRDDVVSGVRVASNAGALRVVADMRGPVPYHVHPEGSSLVVDIGAATAGTPPTAQAPPSSIASEPLDEAPATKPGAPRKKAAKTGDVTAAVKPAVAKSTEPEPPVDLAGAAAPAEPAAAPAPPAHAPALVPEPVAVPAEPRTVKLTPARPEGVFTGQRISLDFKDADIQNVLRVLADVSGLNIIATDDVKGKVTLHLSDVPWDQALDLVLRSNRLEKTRDGNVVRISTVARLKEEREALRAAQDAEKELEPLRVKYLRVNYARADEALVDKVKGVLTDRGSVTFDERTNTIVIRDIPRGIEDATDLVRELDVQSPQVLIEANLVEATRDVAQALGVQWGYIFNAGPQTGNPTGLTFPGTVGLNGSGLGLGTAPPSANGTPRLPVPFMADFPVPTGFSGFGPGAGSALDLSLGSLNGANTLSTRLTALEEVGKAKVISRPRVITMNNVAATIQSLTILRVKLPSTGTVINTGTGGAAGSASTATEKINTGITLVVTPQISSDGYVLLNIYAKSSLPDFTAGRSVDGIPNEISREANSNVLIPNGETVVLGGVFRTNTDNRETGIPFLKDIPVLGWLFKRTLNTDHREELLVFITPKIVANGTASLPTAERLWEERRQGG